MIKPVGRLLFWEFVAELISAGKRPAAFEVEKAVVTSL